MTIDQLIDQLSKFPGEAEILVQNDNYEPFEIEVRELNNAPVILVYSPEETEA